MALWLLGIPPVTASTRRFNRRWRTEYRTTFAVWAIVQATTHWRDAEALLEAEESLGSGMKGIEAASLSEEAQLQTRGW